MMKLLISSVGSLDTCELRNHVGAYGAALTVGRIIVMLQLNYHERFVDVCE